MEQEIDKPALEQKSSLELKKMAKGYGWSIKVYNDDLDKLRKEIKELDNWCEANYGSVLE
ncbi:MAG: hypothetical protein R3321_03005 [Nitrososphaeraceae archaeon]|nr:hypothetical protein [Nitrososphaeraceae archaeon]